MRLSKMLTTNAPIQVKLAYWKQDDVVAQWVADKISNVDARQAQEAYLSAFWGRVSASAEPNKFYLLQNTIVLLLQEGFAFRGFEDDNPLVAIIKGLDERIRRHIINRLVEEFEGLGEPLNMLGMLDKPHKSYKAYWEQVFSLMSSMLYLNEGLSPANRKRKLEGVIGEIIPLTGALQQVRRYFRNLCVSNIHDVIDDVMLFAYTLNLGVPDKAFCDALDIESNVLELAPLEASRFVAKVIHHAHGMALDLFEGYYVLQGGFYLSSETKAALHAQHDWLKNRISSLNKIIKGEGFLDRTLKGCYDFLGDINGELNQCLDEQQVLQKLITFNQTGCLSLNLVSRIAGADASLALSTSTQRCVNVTQSELEKHLNARAQQSKEGPGLGMSEEHTLLKDIHKDLAKVENAGRSVKKGTPECSPALSAVSMDTATGSPYVSPRAKMSNLYGNKGKQGHVHSRVYGDAQKYALREEIAQSLAAGDFTLEKIEKWREEKCCAGYKLCSHDAWWHYFVPAKTTVMANQVKAWGENELAKMAGRDGEAQMEQTREQHQKFSRKG